MATHMKNNDRKRNNKKQSHDSDYKEQGRTKEQLSKGGDAESFGDDEDLDFVAPPHRTAKQSDARRQHSDR